MTTVPFPIVGPTYSNRALPVSNQQTRNFYVEVNPQGAELLSLMPFPGLKLFTTAGTGPNRGATAYDGKLYVVTGPSLYSVDSDQVVTNIGSIDGEARCSFAVSITSGGSTLSIATGVGKPYTWDGTTFTQGTDVDLASSNTVQYLNRRVIYDGSGSDIIFAGLDTPLSVNSLNVASTDTKSDNTIAGLAYQQQYFAFCEESIEPWYQTGVSNPPYSLVVNGVKNIGLSAVHSVAKNKAHAYFLGSDRMPYQMTGISLTPIGNPAIGREIEGYSTVSDAIGFCFNLDSQEFYSLNFPTANVTWLFSEASGLWTSLSSSGGRHWMNAAVDVFGKTMVPDYRNGKIYELDFDTYTDNGTSISHLRDTQTVSGATFGRPDARVFMDRLRLRLDPGASLVTSIAQIMMQYSDDSGRTWSAERWAPIGVQGDYGYIVEWLGLGMFYRRIFRFSMTDPIRWVLIAASVDVELAIDA